MKKQGLKEKLIEAEKCRQSGWGEGVIETGGYSKAIKLAESVLDEIGEPQDREEAILVGEALKKIATSSQSQATHIAQSEKERESLLEQSRESLEKLMVLQEPLVSENLGLDNKFFPWEPEIERLWARYYYKQPRNPKDNLPKAQNHYQGAVDSGFRMLKEVKDEVERLTLMGVIGTAIGEVARVKDERLHQLRERFDEKEIFKLYIEGCDMVWEIRNLPEPDFDRIDAVFWRTFRYLISHDVPLENKEFQKLTSRYKILIKMSKLVSERVEILMEREKIPEGLKRALGY